MLRHRLMNWRGWATAASAATLGVTLLLAAALWSPDVVERALLGDASGRLSWGATLLRLLLAFHGMLALVGAWWVWRSVRTLTSPAPGADLAPADVPGTTHRAGEPIRAWEVATVVALTLAAFGARWVNLGGDLWVDEVETLIDYVRIPLGETLVKFESKNQNTLYSLMAMAAIAVMGDTPEALRMPALVFGVLTVPALWLLARRVGPAGRAGVWVALASAAVLTFAVQHVSFSQSARGYTGLMFFTVLGAWFWLRGLASRGWGDWAGLVASCALGLYVHLTIGFVMVAYLLSFLAIALLGRVVAGGASLGGASLGGASGRDEPGWLGTRRLGNVRAQSLVRTGVALMLSGTVPIMLYAVALPALMGGLKEESLPSAWTSPWWFLQEMAKGLVGDSPVVMVMLVPGLVVMATGWWLIARRSWTAALVIALPPMLPIGYMLLAAHNFWPRWVFFAGGFAIVCVIEGLRWWTGAVASWVGRWTGVARTTVALRVLAGVAVAGYLAWKLPPNYAMPWQDYTGAIAAADATSSPGEAKMAVGLAGDVIRRYFRGEGHAADWVLSEPPAGPIEPEAVRDARELGELSRLVAEADASGRRVWLVYTMPEQHLRSHRPELYGLIASRFEVVEERDGRLGDGDVYVARLREASDGPDPRGPTGEGGEGE